MGKEIKSASTLLLILILVFVQSLGSGCVSAPPYVGKGPHPQIERGGRVPGLDEFGSFISLPYKLILWDWKFNSHSISKETESKLIAYIDWRNLPAFEDTKFRLNQYAPLGELKALFKNRHIAWPVRLIPGLPVTLVYGVLLPGRLFPWGDHYNPFSNTAYLYSDDPAIALHEAGHAYDDADFPHRATYSVLRVIRFVDLYQEWWATNEAIHYLAEVAQDRELELRAYRVLWPAYGSYVGSYIPIPFGGIAGVLIGHLVGRIKAATRKAYYKRMDAVLEAPYEGLRDSPLVDLVETKAVQQAPATAPGIEPPTAGQAPVAGAIGTTAANPLPEKQAA